MAREGGDWMSTEESARYLGVTTRTVYRLINDGHLPAYKFGRVIRLRQPEVDEFALSSRIQPGELDHLASTGNGDEDVADGLAEGSVDGDDTAEPDT